MTAKGEHFDIVLAMLNPDSLWNAPTVSGQPEVLLMDWTIKEDTAGNRYFLGVLADSGESRVSTAIAEFDAEHGRGRTRSGRTYQLLGPSGTSSDAEYLWSAYMFSNGIQEPEK